MSSQQLHSAPLTLIKKKKQTTHTKDKRDRQEALHNFIEDCV